MPYADQDRVAFIERLGITPDMRIFVLNTDGRMPVIVAGKVEGTVIASNISPNPLRAAKLGNSHHIEYVVVDPEHSPFSAPIFDLVLAYQPSFNTPDLLRIFQEVKRILNHNGRFALVTKSPAPENDAQESDLLLSRILDRLGLLVWHEFGKISKGLQVADFTDITMEVFKRHVVVPEEWIKGHMLTLKQKAKGTLVMDMVNEYCRHVQEYGEELLPAVQFVAYKA